jgi:class 3 adenylate cyclase
MRYPNKLIDLCINALSQSMDTRVMTALARTIISGYNLHEQTGLPASYAVPNREAASQIVRDMINNETFLDFILLLIKIGDNGYRGRSYRIPYLRDIINEVISLGFLYDPENDMFMENSAERKTRNWGTLRKGVEYTITFLRVDIVGNSELVRRYTERQIAQAYGAVREIVKSAVERRDGRIWNWDGDGGLAAFFRGHKHQHAVLAGMEILHELFLYDYTRNPLDEPLKVRIAAHSGPFEYSADATVLENNETVARVREIEEYLCEPASMTVSEVVKMMLDSPVLGRLREFRDDSHKCYYAYSLTMEAQ